MSTIAVTNIADGDAVTASSVNNQINTIVNDYNGGITAANLATDSVTTAKILADNITNAKLADASVLPEQLVAGAGTSWAWQSYTPTWTNVTIGNATVTAKYCQIGKMVFGKLSMVLGTTTSLSGTVIFSLPVTSTTVLDTRLPIGSAQINDTGTNAYPGLVVQASTTTAQVYVHTTLGGANPVFVQGTNSFNNTGPFVAATGDGLFCSFFYEAA